MLRSLPRRRLVAGVVLGGSLVALGSEGAGCSSSSSSAGAHDAGGGEGDAGAGGGDAGAVASDGLPLCGTDEAGSVVVGMIVTGIALDPSQPPPPVGGAVFTSPACPGLTETTDAAGHLRGHVPRGQTFYGRLDARGFAPTLVPELLFDGDAPDIEVTLPPGLLTSLVPGWDDAHAAIFLDTFAERATATDGGADGGAGACAKVDGVSFAVDGQPEAKVTYYSTDAIPAPVDGATATTASGKAAISGLPGGVTVRVVATKPGCAPTLTKGNVTGRSPLENGYVTIAGVYLHGP